MTHISSCRPPTRSHATLSWRTSMIGLQQTTSGWTVQRVKNSCSVPGGCEEDPCNLHHRAMELSASKVSAFSVSWWMTGWRQQTMSATYSRLAPDSFTHYGFWEQTDYPVSHYATSPEPQWFPGLPTVRQPGRACALPLTGRGCMRSWGAVDVLGTWMTLTPSLSMNCSSSLLTINCSRKLSTTQLTFFSLWFQTAHHHLMISDHALMTNFCWIKLHTLMNVNFSFACSMKTVIDYSLYIHELFNFCVTYCIHCHSVQAAFVSLFYRIKWWWWWWVHHSQFISSSFTDSGSN